MRITFPVGCTSKKSISFGIDFLLFTAPARYEPGRVSDWFVIEGASPRFSSCRGILPNRRPAERIFARKSTSCRAPPKHPYKQKREPSAVGKCLPCSRLTPVNRISNKRFNVNNLTPFIHKKQFSQSLTFPSSSNEFV